MHMCRVLIFFTVVSLFELAFSQLQPASNPALNTRSFVQKNCDGVKTFICDSCTSRQPCFGEIKGNGSFPCDTGFYCTEGIAYDRCNPTPSNECLTSTLGSTFTCTSRGISPDPVNCNIYHVCLGAGETSSIYKCPPGYVFSVQTSACIRQLTAANCVTVRCPVGDPSYVLYGSNRQYYVTCDGQNQPTRVLRCPTGAFFTYFTSNTRIGECVYSCSGQGNYPNSNNPSSYYQCFISNGRLVYTELDCPTGTLFNQTLQFCIRQ
ncbi:uncharacterized protein LOC128725085 [Anopheles nili]|uniref:uncharacterized protein LOC128725085 n=1 Tax=Anopheles nili TaxID=185578 RepID=UPI00237B0E00|nr:uncharacterized protein LOC128725085 [Anopheles nili]